MECPICHKYNPEDSKYCQFCGASLTRFLDSLMMILMMIIILLLSGGAVGYLVYDLKNDSYKAENKSLKQEKEQLSELLDSVIIQSSSILDNNKKLRDTNKELNEQNKKLNEQNKKLNEQNDDLVKVSRDAINQLKSSLPQKYQTIYAHQNLYETNIDGDFVENGWFYEDANNPVLIYTQKDGYGLTEDGWLPMNRLKKE